MAEFAVTAENNLDGFAVVGDDLFQELAERFHPAEWGRVGGRIDRHLSQSPRR